MKIKASLFVIALSGIAASCGAVPSDLPGTAPALTEMGVDGAEMRPAPAGETAANAGQRFARLRQLDAASIPVRGASAIGPGRYVGNLELKERHAIVQGAGFGETVIEGNLIVGSQCRVTGLTVTGDVLFSGNNAFSDVECLGQVIDYGVQNQH